MLWLIWSRFVLLFLPVLDSLRVTKVIPSPFHWGPCFSLGFCGTAGRSSADGKSTLWVILTSCSQLQAWGFRCGCWEDFDKEERTVVFFFMLLTANEKAFHLGVVGHIYGNMESSCNIYSSYRSDWIYLLLIRIYMPTEILLHSSWEYFI